MVLQAIAWCPWQPSVVASGGGLADRTIKLWNINMGSLLTSKDTGSQVRSNVFSQSESHFRWISPCSRTMVRTVDGPTSFLAGLRHCMVRRVSWIGYWTRVRQKRANTMEISFLWTDGRVNRSAMNLAVGSSSSITVRTNAPHNMCANCRRETVLKRTLPLTVVRIDTIFFSRFASSFFDLRDGFDTMSDGECLCLYVPPVLLNTTYWICEIFHSIDMARLWKISVWGRFGCVHLLFMMELTELQGIVSSRSKGDEDVWLVKVWPFQRNFGVLFLSSFRMIVSEISPFWSKYQRSVWECIMHAQSYPNVEFLQVTPTVYWISAKVRINP